MGGGEAEGSVVAVTESQELGVGLPLGDQVSESVAVSQSVQTEAIGTGVGQDRGGYHGMVSDGRVVDEGGGCSEDFGVSVDDSGVPLDNSVGEAESVSIAEAE